MASNARAARTDLKRGLDALSKHFAEGRALRSD
jgi:hypothetical protein